MTDLIPLLSAVTSAGRSESDRILVPATFVEEFLAVHDRDWGRAQAHWERVVERVLDTDAVDPRAGGRRAIRQAVQATVILLARSDLRGRCPLCPRIRLDRLPAARGGSDG